MATKNEQSVFLKQAERVSANVATQVKKLEEVLEKAKDLPSQITPMSERVEDLQIQI